MATATGGETGQRAGAVVRGAVELGGVHPRAAAGRQQLLLRLRDSHPAALAGYTLLNKYCFGTSAAFPLLEKIVPDSSTNMSEVEVIYLVSLTHIAAITADTIKPIAVVEVRHIVANPPYCFNSPAFSDSRW